MPKEVEDRPVPITNNGHRIIMINCYGSAAELKYKETIKQCDAMLKE